MLDKLGNNAFIDSQNLNLSILDQDWKLDYRRFVNISKINIKSSKPFCLLDLFQPSRRYIHRFSSTGIFLFLNLRLNLKMAESKAMWMQN